MENAYNTLGNRSSYDYRFTVVWDTIYVLCHLTHFPFLGLLWKKYVPDFDLKRNYLLVWHNF
jgi:hypothetical protein